MSPVHLDPTDESILGLLAEHPGVRAKTPQIAFRLQRDPKSIGKNLVNLRRAGLIDNIPRQGFQITKTGIARSRR
jgi:Mn-dependent DtxR family transcriptional regulator